MGGLLFILLQVYNKSLIKLICTLTGAVANAADSNRCNPKVPSSIPAGGKNFPSTKKFNHIALCRGGAHKSTGPLCVYSELKYGK